MPNLGGKWMQTLRKYRLDKNGLPSRAAVVAYERDGVVCLENAFDEAWVAQGRRAVAAAIGTAGRSQLREDHAESGEKSLFFFDTFYWPRRLSCTKFTLESPAARLARTVMRSQSLLLYFDMAIVKEPGTSATTPWHYDEAYWPVSGTQVCNVWMALDDVPEDTALRFVLGSHKLDQDFKGIDFFTKKGMQGQTNPSPPDWDNEAHGLEIASAPMKAGDCAILNFRTHHSAPGNPQKRQRRRVICTHWFGDDARYADKQWECNPNERGDNLVDGGRLECATFPRVI